MSVRRAKTKPSWTDVKARLVEFDRPGLIALIQDLYAAGKDNQTFLHARFGLGEDVILSYKETIHRWVWPDVFRRETESVAKAKQAIAHYKKAVGDPAGLAELMVFYCEGAAGYCADVGFQDEAFFNALCRMFEQALATASTLPGEQSVPLIARLDKVRLTGHKFGYGVGETMDDAIAPYRSRLK